MYVLTEHPLQFLLRSLDFMGRIAKWGIRLDSFDIRYKPKNAIKGQVLANFVAKFTLAIGDAHRMCQVLVRPCKVYVDGASNARGSRTRIVLKSLKGIRVEDLLSLGFQTSNNEAKYEALVARLQVAVKVKATEVEIFLDLRLVVSQVKGDFVARDPRMVDYLKLVHSLQTQFRSMKVAQISRGQNSHADSLATLALSIEE